MTEKRLGVLGGTFDPIHYGHLALAEDVRVTLGLDEIIFIPAGQPPHKTHKKVTDAQHRLTMVQLATQSNPHFSVSTIEIDRDGPSYLVDTLRELRDCYGTSCHLSFLMGWDSLWDLPGWYNAQGIIAQLSQLVVVPRPGFPIPDGYEQALEERLPGMSERLRLVHGPLLDIASRDLRKRRAEGRAIKYQLPEAVEDYIIHNRLYESLE